MIFVTRLNGSEIAVNTELLATVEATPDTLLILVNGTKILVKESVEEVVERITAYRRSVHQISHLRPVREGQ